MIKVFINCSSCDMPYIQQEINWINHVRDQDVADVQVFVAGQTTASMGRKFELSFTGKTKFEGINNTFSFTTESIITPDELRNKLKKNIELGLVPYIAHTGLLENISLMVRDSGLQKKAIPKDDPWNKWIFDVNSQTNLNQEQSFSNFLFQLGLEADRATEEWKFRSNSGINMNTRTIYTDADTIVSINQRSWSNATVVKSLGNHWSAGIAGSFYSNTFQNLKESFSGGPAIEYSFFPYSQVMKREITLAYRLNFGMQTYFEETIFEKMSDKISSHSLNLGVRYIQPWGTTYARVSGSHFLNNLEYRRLTVSNWTSVRIFKGLSMRLNAQFSLIRDQIFLPRREATEAEIFLRQRSLATSYDLYLGGGLNYKFGSIYNNVVNTRL